MLALPTIKGTPAQALSVCTIPLLFQGIANLGMLSLVVSSMKDLDDRLKLLLNLMPVLSMAVFQLPFSKQIVLNGGKNFLRFLRCLSLSGVFAITIMSFSLSLEKINSFSWEYALVCLFNFMVGSFAATNQLALTVSFWSRSKEEAVRFRTKLLGLGTSALGIFLILLEFAISGLGIPVSFSIFLGFSIITTLISEKYFQAPPVHQLTAHFNDFGQAKTVAKNSGYPFAPGTLTPDLYGTFKKAYKPFAVLLFGVLASLGSSFFLNTNLFLVLTKLINVSKRNAVLITAFGALWSTFMRAMSGIFIAKHDPSGVKFFGVSMLFAAMGALVLGAASFLNLATVIAAQILMSTGYGIAASAISQTLFAWSGHEDNGFNRYNLSEMNGIVNASAALLTGLCFPLLTIAFLSSDADRGYQHAFLFIGLLTIAATAAVSVTHRYFNNSSIFFCWKKDNKHFNDHPEQLSSSFVQETAC